ncbi:MAG: hypothetical protein V3R96_06950 [Dehalococcoidales bacterium]
MRKKMFWLTIVTGLVLAIGGFFLSAPIGPPINSAISNPRVPFSPTVFVLGVMLLFGSAVVYELTPGGSKEK